MFSYIRIISIRFSNDSFYRNSMYLMISTGITTLIGFLFWTICARLYSPIDIGNATALISLIALISNLSLVGLNTGIIKYLNAFHNKSNLINSSILIVSLFSLILAIIYVLFIDTFTPKLSFITANIPMSFFFLFFVVVASIHSLSESIFIAYRSTKYILIYNTIFSLVKLVLAILFVLYGALGIFNSYAIGVLIASLFTFYFLIVKFDYKPKISIDMKLIKRIAKFSFASYLAGFIGGLPGMIFPILILNYLGAEKSAYYYIDMMIISILYIIPITISQSLFAESTHDEQNMNKQIVKSLRLSSLLLIPAIIFILIFGKDILLILGKSFSTEGLTFLNLMTISSIFIPANYIFGILLRVRNKVKEINIAVTLSTISTLFVSYSLLKYELLGIGAGLILGQLVMLSYYIFVYKYILNKSFKLGF